MTRRYVRKIPTSYDKNDLKLAAKYVKKGFKNVAFPRFWTNNFFINKHLKCLFIF